MTRLLVVGWTNSPHVTEWAREMSARGWEVRLAGEAEPSLPQPPAGAIELRPAGLPGMHAAAMARDLDRLEADFEPHVVHAHWLTSFGWMAARASARPLVVSAWGSDVLRAGVFARRRSRLALESADAVLADSRALAQAAAALAPAAPSARIVNWGVDTRRFTPGDRAAARERVGLEGGGPVVMGIRGLAPLYNAEVLREAFSRVSADFPSAQLVFKHPHSDAPGIPGARVVGNVPEEQLADWYRAAEVCVSIPDTDSSPRSVWEALACGAPTVISDLPWAREWIEDGEQAMLVPARPEPVAEALVSLLRDASLRTRLGERGRRLVEQQMDRDTQMSRVDDLYRSLIA